MFAKTIVDALDLATFDDAEIKVAIVKLVESLEKDLDNLDYSIGPEVELCIKNLRDVYEETIDANLDAVDDDELEVTVSDKEDGDDIFDDGDETVEGQ